MQALIETLAPRGYRVVGLVVRDDVIVYDDEAGIGGLPAGWAGRQDTRHLLLCLELRELHHGRPTCFCTSVADRSDLSGQEAARVRC